MKKGVDYIGVGTGAMVFNDRGEVLIGKRGSHATNEVGKWEFPGGGVEFGETCEAEIVREIREEFNIEIEVVEMLDFANHILPEEGQHWVSITFIAQHVGGEPQILEPTKVEEFKWVEPEQLEMGELSQVSQENLRNYRAR